MDNKHQNEKVIPRIDFHLLNLILKGLGQIMLQENALTGLLFLAGIFYGSALMGLAALVAVTSGTLTAVLLKYDTRNLNKGLYGFSASLTGVAMMLFFKPAPMTWMAVVAGSVLATVKQHFFLRMNIPVFTLPFVLVTWLALVLFGRVSPDLLAIPGALPVNVANPLSYSIRGFGQVIFQENVISSVLFFLAVFISSPVAALYGIAGAMVSGVLATLSGAPAGPVGSGLYSFNAVLCAMVFAGKKLKDAIEVFISVLLSLLISFIMHHFNITQLTFPFVAASFLVLSFSKHVNKKP